MKRHFFCFLLCWLGWAGLGAGSLWAEDGASPNGGASNGFLDRTRRAAVEVAESDAGGATTTGIDNLNEGFKVALEKGLTSDKYKKLLGRAGKYAKVVDVVLKAIKFGNLSNECRVALVNGDRAEFAENFNKLVRELVKTAAGMAGSAKGGKIGLLGLKGGALVILTVPLGAVFGGLLAEKLAEEAYDGLIADSMTDLGGLVFDSMQAEGAGKPKTGPPPGIGLPHPDGEAGEQGEAPLKLRAFR